MSPSLIMNFTGEVTSAGAGASDNAMRTGWSRGSAEEETGKEVLATSRLMPLVFQPRVTRGWGLHSYCCGVSLLVGFLSRCPMSSKLVLHLLLVYVSVALVR